MPDAVAELRPQQLLSAGNEAMEQATAKIPTVAIRAACGCGSARSLPIRLVSDALARLREESRGVLAPDEPVLTYRCRHCKEIVVLRARNLFLSE